MANNASLPNVPLIDLQTGMATLAFKQWHEEMFNGVVKRGNIGKALSGVAAAQAEAAASIEAANTVQTNSNAASSSTSAVTISTNLAAVFVSGEQGTSLRGQATVTITGGATPYNVSVERLSGSADVTASLSATTLDADGSVSVTFEGGLSGSPSATFRVAVTDSAETPEAEAVQISASFVHVDFEDLIAPSKGQIP